MSESGHLWAVGYDGIDRAREVRDTITELGWTKHYLALDDVAVVVRHADGSYDLARERFPAGSNVLGVTAVGVLAGLVLGFPLAGAAIGAMVGGTGGAFTSLTAGLSDEFVADVKAA